MPSAASKQKDQDDCNYEELLNSTNMKVIYNLNTSYEDEYIKQIINAYFLFFLQFTVFLVLFLYLLTVVANLNAKMFH